MKFKFSNYFKILSDPRLYPLFLLLVGFAAYGLLLRQPGFYWDDWENVYLYALHTPSISFLYFYERPLLALLYLVLFPITKITPLVWLIISFILRYLGVLGLTLTMMRVWPNRSVQIRWIGLILLTMPAFLQQPIALCYSKTFFAFTLFSFSLYTTVLAINSRKCFWLWFPLSVILGLIQFFTLEYFIGFEFLRPIIIWLLLNPKNRVEKKSALIKTLRLWSPFVIGLILFLFYRFYGLPIILAKVYHLDTEYLNFLVGDKNSPDLILSFISSPIKSSLALLRLIFLDAKYLFFNVWVGRFSSDQFNIFDSKISRLAWASAVISALLALIHIRDSQAGNKTPVSNSRASIMVFGLVAFLSGGIPFWSASHFITANMWSDRYAIASMFGATILIVYIIDWLFRTNLQKQLLLSVLLMVAVSLQVFNNSRYRQSWNLQRDIYWQIAWRVPSLKPGTAILGMGTFTDKNNSFDAMYELNLLLEKQVQITPRYGYFSIYQLNKDQLEPDSPLISAPIRTGRSFEGSTNQAIGLYFDREGGCVRIMDGVYAGDSLITGNFARVLHLSNSNLVMESDLPTSPNRDIFGPEPQHNWCYYFEKADLARQQKDWNTILGLKMELDSLGYKPALGIEYIPFIEAYAQTGDWRNAFSLSQTALEISPNIKQTLCDNWQRFSTIPENHEQMNYLNNSNDLFCASFTE